jgi:hypothetical protein
MIKEPLYNLRVPEREKYTEDGKWFKDYMNFIIPYDNSAISDYRKMKLWYDVINDNIEGFKDEMKKFCKSIDLEKLAPDIAFDEEIQHYNRLFSKFSYLVGEMLKRKDKHYAAFLSQDALEFKDEELMDALIEAIQEKMMLAFEETKMKMAGASPIDVMDYDKEMSSGAEPEDIVADFKSSLEVFANKCLEHFYYAQEVQRKKSMSYKHAIVSDREIIYVGEQYGKPGIHVINPLHFGFHKSPDEFRIEKGDYAWSRTSTTMTEILNQYGDVLSQEDIEKISLYDNATSLRVNKKHDAIGGTAEPVYDRTSLDLLDGFSRSYDKSVGQAQGSGANRRFNSERLIYKTHFEFKAFRQLTFVFSFDDTGKEVIDVHPDNYEIPKEAVKESYINRYGRKSIKYEWVDSFGNIFRAEKMWVPRRYEVTRIGQDVFLNYREVPNQPMNLEDPFGSFTLSYKGRIFTSLNAESISLIGRALTGQFQYNIVKHLQAKEIDKYEGFIKNIDIDQIPDYLAQDEEGNPLGYDKLYIWRYYRKILGDSYTSGTQNSLGLPPNPNRTRAVQPEIAGAFSEIITMQQMLELIDREIGMAMCVPQQAEGRFSPNSNASDNQRALDQGFTMMEWYMVEHAELWRAVSEEYLNQFSRYYKRFFEDNPDVEEVSLHYLGSDGKQILKISPKHLDFGDMGLFLHADNSDEEYRRVMMTQLQPIAQNAAEGVEVISSLVKAVVTGKSPAEIHKMVSIAAKEQAARMQELEKQRAEQMIRAQAEHRALVEDQQSHELDKIVLQASLPKEDADGIPTEVEVAKAMNDIAVKNQMMEIENRKAAVKEREVVAKEIAAKSKT